MKEKKKHKVNQFLLVRLWIDGKKNFLFLYYCSEMWCSGMGGK